MRLSENGLRLIQAWEGIEDGDPSTVDLEPYICPAKVYTVGWGHALTTPTGAIIDVDVFGPARARTLAREAMQRRFGKQAINRAEAEALLREDVRRFEVAVERAIGAGNATQAQFDALVSLCFNIGAGNFGSSSVKRFHVANNRRIGDISMSTLCRESKAGTIQGSMARAFVAWSKANKRWMLGLFRRRLSEVMIYAGHEATGAVRTSQGFRGC